MCGLLGLAYHKDSALTPELAGLILSQLQLRNEVRGGDSFGLGVVVPDDKDIRLYKSVGRISKLTSGEPSWAHGVRRVMDQMRAGKSVVAIGHNRKATTGANTERNAHPFLCGKADDTFVIGAHNGMISPWSAIKTHWQIQQPLQVDSEVIFRGLHKFIGEERGDVKVLGQLCPLGTIATTYMRDYQTLNLYRADNPLSIAVGDGFIFWSSTETHLRESTFGLDVKYPKIETDTLVRFNLDTFNVEEVDVPKDYGLRMSMFPRVSTVEIEGKPTGKSVIKADRRSSTPSQRKGLVEHKLADSLFRRPGSSATVGFDTGVDPLSNSVEIDPKVVDITQYQTGHQNQTISAQMPAQYVHHPRDPKDKICCRVCDGHSSGERKPDSFEPWELLWYGGDPLCPVCYYYVVGAEAEQEIARRTRSTAAF